MRNKEKLSRDYLILSKLKESSLKTKKKKKKESSKKN